MDHKLKSENKNTQKPILLLVDGSNIVFRMFFALERSGLRAPDGRPSWAIFGTVKAIFEMIVKTKPNLIITAFDAPGGTFRDKQFEYYKANRPTEMPPDLAAQWPEIQRALQIMDLKMMVEPGLEADDLIGSAAKKAVEQGFKVYILSGDRDNFQLVNDDVTVLYPDMKGWQTLDALGVQEKMGVTPNQIIDFKALCGDSSDNIPGVAGIGPKTAISLIEQFGTLENIYQNLDQVKSNSVREKLLNNKQNAFDSKFLATIKTDCHLEENLLDVTKAPHPNPTDLATFLDGYKLTSLKKMLPQIMEILGHQGFVFDPSDQAEITSKPEQSTIQIETRFVDFEVEKISNLIKEAEYLDLEFTTVYKTKKDRRPTPTGFAICWKKKNEAQTHYSLTTFNIDGEINTGELQKFFTHIAKQFEGQIFTFDLKQQIHLAKQLELTFPDKVLDVKLAAYLENSTQKLDLGSLAAKHNISGLNQETVNYAQSLPFCLFLGDFYLHNLPEKVLEIWLNMESPLSYTLARMEQNGVYIDLEQMKKIDQELGSKIIELEKSIKLDLRAEQININSSRQLGQALADFGFKMDKNTATKQISTDRNVLEELAAGDETGIINRIIEHRTLSKLKSTYTDSLPHEISPVDHRIHGEFQQTQAATGRLSSINPNLQNIPIRNEEYGQKIRSCFAAEPGNVLICADYSQIELRFLAHFCQDPLLLDTFRENQDVHQRTAAEIFDIPFEQVTSSQRRLGKTLNFALVYQQGAFATARMLGISNKEATAYINKYFAKFARVKPFVEEVLEGARTKGYVETFWGRRRYFENLNSSKVMLRKLDERAAFNAVLQGSNADLIKLAMLRLENDFIQAGVEFKLILQVHDELVLEVKQDLAEQARNILTKTMELDQPLSVPIVVGSGVGKNWAEAKE